MPSKSKIKGSTFERNLAKFLNETYKTNEFARTPMSGALVGRTNWNKVTAMSDSTKASLASDIIVPEFFKFSVEAKAYKDSPDFANIVKGHDGDLNKWIGKSCYDAIHLHLLPMVTFKINNKGVFFVVPTNIVTRYLCEIESYFVYNGYFMVISEKSFVALAPFFKDIPDSVVDETLNMLQDSSTVAGYIKLHSN